MKDPKNKHLVCELGEYKFRRIRLPDEFTYSVLKKNKRWRLVLTEVFFESESENKERQKQIERDELEFGGLSMKYESGRSIVTAIQEGSRKRITEMLFREISTHAKFFLGESALAVYDSVLVVRA